MPLLCILFRLNWAKLEGINRACEIVVLGPVGKTDGTEWARPVSGTID